ncbi:LysE family translocator [Agrobacterium sp. ES01]|uniref:LysE family translocator n=1 Tax=Agrobacterium sp. ES01 TaxID=3420714 RepID=UPI003D10432C
MTPEFLLTALVVVLIPGTGALYTIAMGLTAGRRAALLASLGCTAGILPHMAAAILGLAAVLKSSDTAFSIVKIAGVTYLIYMAITMLRSGLGGTSASPEKQKRGLGIVTHAVMINLLNPKLSLFFLAFLPQFVDPEVGNAVPALLLDSAVFMAMTLIVFALYSLFAAAMHRHVLERPRVLLWLRRAFAGAFLAMGLKLALTQR